jgi:hypothetical protein
MTAPKDDWDEDEREALGGLEGELGKLRERHADDPPLEVLRAAQGDALPPELQASVARHLSESAWSRALVEGLEDAGQPLDSAAQERLLARVRQQAQQPGRNEVSRSWLRPALAAAMLAAAMVAVYSSVPVVAPPAPPSGAPRAAASSPTVPTFVLPLEKPAVRLSAAVLTWRRDAGENRLLADLEPALEAYGKGDYADAERRLAALSSRHSRSVEVLFYLGVTRLFLDDAPGAIAALGAAERIADTGFAADVSWYRAIAEERAGNRREARARLEALCRGASARAPRACEAARQLDSVIAPATSR